MITWSCMVCGEKRPDDKISVASSEHVLPGGAVLKKNVRYCNDQPECKLGAEAMARVYP